MPKWLQRIRGALGTALTWAAAWAPLGAVAGVVLHATLPAGPLEMGAVVARNVLTFAALGFVGGAIFAPLLQWTEGHRHFHQLSLRRFAVWGAIGGLCLGGIAVMAGLWGAGLGPVGVGMVGAAVLLGAGSASGSLALARRAKDRGLLDRGAAVSPGTVRANAHHPRLRSGA